MPKSGRCGALRPRQIIDSGSDSHHDGNLQDRRHPLHPEVLFRCSQADPENMRSRALNLVSELVHRPCLDLPIGRAQRTHHVDPRNDGLQPTGRFAGYPRRSSIEEVSQFVTHPSLRNQRDVLDARDLLGLLVAPSAQDPGQRHAVRQGEECVVGCRAQLGRTARLNGGVYVGQAHVCARSASDGFCDHRMGSLGLADSMNELPEDSFCLHGVSVGQSPAHVDHRAPLRLSTTPMVLSKM